MKKLNLKLGGIKEMLTREQMKKVLGGDGYGYDDSGGTKYVCTTVTTYSDGSPGLNNYATCRDQTLQECNRRAENYCNVQKAGGGPGTSCTGSCK